MKKGLVLGAAALATVALAPVAEAGTVSMKGYYMFRVQSVEGGLYDGDFLADTHGTGTADESANAMRHRLEVNTEFKASEKTHAHMKFRFVDGTVEGADSNVLGQAGAVAAANTVKQAWLETEAYGVALKMGNMPITLNDGILVNHDSTAFGTFLLAKSFGDVTVIAADVKVTETDVQSSTDDTDLYAVSVLGKIADVNLQLTYAHLNAGYDFAAAPSVSDNWLGLTGSGAVAGIDYTATLLYEAGADYTGGNNTNQLDKAGWLGAVRLNGKTGFGAWNAYGFYASKNFDSISDDNMVWSNTWDMGGPGGTDLLGTWATAADRGNAVRSTDPSSNLWGIGAGLTVMAGGWKIVPQLDYVAVVEKDLNNDGVVTAADGLFDSAIAGSLFASTEIDTGTTLMIGGAYGNFDKGAGFNNGVSNIDDAGFVEASIKMAF
ncbi:hypothetical protein Mmc1_3749 [Magnetococcus marinus MC-1]|uniref:Porin domain-containing protein n=1 Tax=Magnetococcus marinus (strain ATCC BAA-1437 / JCM 17883 / MC-1) TaxID=156889 RepID=A0LE41_MAGMM|nr:hypothetical protein [Magnetococcus marinus]ABK46234.1 hypothetical protein Mmc1_3749 [Magnetococcus marinus MC-1]